VINKMDIDAKVLTDYIANVLKGIHDSDNSTLKDYSPTQDYFDFST